MRPPKWIFIEKLINDSMVFKILIISVFLKKTQFNLITQ
jgi:hypothetical protein